MNIKKLIKSKRLKSSSNPVIPMVGSKRGVCDSQKVGLPITKKGGLRWPKSGVQNRDITNRDITNRDIKNNNSSLRSQGGFMIKGLKRAIEILEQEEIHNYEEELLMEDLLEKLYTELEKYAPE